LALFERATQLAPSFAPAWARVAMTHAYLAASTRNVLEPRYQEHVPLARAALARANAIDPALAAAEDAAFHLAMLEDDLIGAERHARRLSELDRRGALHHSEALMERGRWDESLVAARDYATLDPRSTDAWTVLGNRLFGLRRYAEARDAYQRAQALGSTRVASRIASAELCSTGDWRRFAVARRDGAADPIGAGYWAWQLGDDDGQRMLAATRADYERKRSQPGAQLGLLELEPYLAALDIVGDRAEVQRLLGSTSETFRIEDPRSVPPGDRPGLFVQAAAFYRIAGRRDDALAALADAAAMLPETSRGSWVAHTRIAIGRLYGELGEPVAATQWIGAGLADRSAIPMDCPWYIWHERGLAALRSHAPYRALMARHGVDLDRSTEDHGPTSSEGGMLP
jgi:tetratricopeptide (TPR) repeat protein